MGKSVTSIQSTTQSTENTGQLGGVSLGTGAVQVGEGAITDNMGTITYNPFTDNVANTVQSSLAVANRSLIGMENLGKSLTDLVEDSFSVVTASQKAMSDLAQASNKNTGDVLATKETQGLSPMIPWLIGGVAAVLIFANWKR